MQKNNLIWLMQSLVFLPIMTGTLPSGSIVSGVNLVTETVSSVFVEKENIVIEPDSIVAFNQALEAKDREREIRLLKADLIDGYFSSHDMPLVGQGRKMVEEAENNNLDWRLLPAIAVRESTGGKHDCIRAENNAFGWGSCKIGFKSDEEAIETVAKNLGGNNPNTAKYYAGKNVKEILRAYNPPSVVPKYAEQVMAIMKEIGEADPAISTDPTHSLPS